MSKRIVFLVLTAIAVAAGAAPAAAEEATSADVRVRFDYLNADTVEAGEVLLYRLRWENLGSTMTAMRAEHPVPGTLRSFTGHDGVECEQQGSTIVCNSLYGLFSGEATFTVVFTGAGSPTMTASASSELADPDPSNNAATRTVTVTPPLVGAWRERPSNIPRWGAASAHDPERGEVVVFGGINSFWTMTDTATTYLWDELGWRMTNDTTETILPPARSFASMAYNPADKTVVLFGGVGGDGLALGDTWVWDGAAWTRKLPASAPPARMGGAMTTLNGTVVLFGGYGDTQDFNDTWVWNGSTWAKKTTSTAPPARGDHVFVADDARGHAVLFGGCCDADDLYLGDTWLWDGSSWTKKSPAASPAARGNAAAAYDRSTSSVTVFGGYGNDDQARNDTWSWNGSSWQQRSVAAAPPAREGHIMAFSRESGSAPGRLIVAGGLGQNLSVLADTWSILPQQPAAVSVSPPSIAFGTVAAGIGASRAFSVVNNGDIAVAVGSMGASAGFSVDPGSCAGATLAPGASCSASARFAPATAGAKSGSITVQTGGGSAAVSLGGIGALPTLTTTPIASHHSVNASFPVWWGSGGLSGVTFDVEYAERLKSSSGAWVQSAWKTWMTGVSGTSAWFGGSGQPASGQGRSFLFRVRVRDGSATGVWTPVRSTVVPLDDRNWTMKATAGWSALSQAGRYFGAHRQASRAGETLTLTYETNMITVIGEKCPGCGAFDVYVDGAKVARVDSYYGAKTMPRQPLYSRYLPGGIKRHTVKIVVAGTKGRPWVKLDGIAAAR